MRETLTSNPELFSDISWNLLLLGEETAKKWDHSEFNIEHIIHTLFSSSEFFAFIEKLSIDQDTVLDITEDFLEETPTNESDIFTIGEDLEILLDNANQIKIQWGSRLIEIPHLLIALGRDLRIGNYVFEEGNLSMEKLEEELKSFPNINQAKESFNYENVIEINNQSNFESNNETFVKEEKLKKAIVPLPKSELQIETKKQVRKDENALSIYGKDLTESAKKGLLDPVLGRENEINNLMRVLCRRNKNNPILIGNPGVGKTSIAKLLAQLIVDKKVPDTLKDLKIISLDLGALVSGTKFRGQLEERLSLIMQELNNPNQGMILFIDNLIGFDMRTDGERGSFLNLPSKNNKDSIIDNIDFSSGAFSPIQMNGQEVYKFAVREVPIIIDNLLKKTNYCSHEVDWLVLHQANQRILDSVGDRLKIPREKILSNLEKYGNTSAATIPLVIDEAIRNNRIKQNDIIAISGFGAGLSWGAALIKWG